MRLADENAVWHADLDNLTLRRSQGSIDLGTALKVDASKFAALVDEGLQEVLEKVAKYKMPTQSVEQ